MIHPSLLYTLEALWRHHIRIIPFHKPRIYKGKNVPLRAGAVAKNYPTSVTKSSKRPPKRGNNEPPPKRGIATFDPPFGGEAPAPPNGGTVVAIPRLGGRTYNEKSRKSIQNSGKFFRESWNFCNLYEKMSGKIDLLIFETSDAQIFRFFSHPLSSTVQCKLRECIFPQPEILLRRWPGFFQNRFPPSSIFEPGLVGLHRGTFSRAKESGDALPNIFATSVPSEIPLNFFLVGSG